MFVMGGKVFLILYVFSLFLNILLRNLNTLDATADDPFIQRCGVGTGSEVLERIVKNIKLISHGLDSGNLKLTA